MHPTLDDLKKTSRVKKIVQGNHFFQISCFHDIMLISNRALYSSKSLNNRMLHLSSTRILEEVKFDPKENENSLCKWWVIDNFKTYSGDFHCRMKIIWPPEATKWLERIKGFRMYCRSTIYAHKRGEAIRWIRNTPPFCI